MVMFAERPASRLWTLLAASAAMLGVGVAVIEIRRGRGARAREAPRIPWPHVPEPTGRRAPTAMPPRPVPERQERAINPSYLKAPSMTSNLTGAYTTETWRAAITPLAVFHGVPVPFVLDSLQEESQGNPCAIGNPEQYGPDGNPREMGIYQFYNPDDLKLLGATGAELRAYCSPDKVTYHKKDGTTVQGPSQQVIRELTADEMAKQAQMTIDKIVKSKIEAGHYALASGVTWPSDSIDFWRLVKLVHGLPGLVHGLAQVTAYLGRAPRSWSEFRSVIGDAHGAVQLDANTEAHRPFGWIFDNAEKATAGMPGEPIA